MNIFNGKSEAIKLDKKINGKIREIVYPKTLLIVQIGNNPSSEKFVDLKIKYCNKIGVNTVYKKIKSSLDDTQIINMLTKLFSDEKIDGGIIQLPLPRKSLQNVLNLIPFDKDVDVLSDIKREQFYQKKIEFLPPTIRALLHFLSVTKVNIKDKEVTILGGGELVGKPASFYLSSLGAKIILLDRPEVISSTFGSLNNIRIGKMYKRGQTIRSDLIISAVGNPYFLDPKDIAAKTNVIDFGSTVVGDTTIGDLDTRESIEHLGTISLSPGGMGPLVIRYLIANLIGL